MRLLQEPLLALEQRIKQEIEMNPALEELTPEADQEEVDVMEEELPPTDSVDGDEDEIVRETEDDVSHDNDDFSLEDYIDDDEIPDYRLKINNSSPDDEVRETPLASGISYQEFLLGQVGLQTFTPRETIIATIWLA